MLRCIRPLWLFKRSQVYKDAWCKNWSPLASYGVLLRHPANYKVYSTSSKHGKENIRKRQVEVQDTSSFEILSMTLHDLMSHSDSTNSEGSNQCAELIVPRYSLSEGTEQMPIYNDVYFEQIEHEMNGLIFKLQQDIVNFNRWVVTAKATSLDSIDVAMLPYDEGKFCIYVFTKAEYHRDFLESFSRGVEGLHYDATSATDGKINVQNVKSADLQKVVEQIKKGNMHKIAQVSTPGTQLMKRKPPPKPPTNSAEAEQDVSIPHELTHTMEAKGAAMVGGHVLQVMDQGCDLMFIDHGQRHSLRLMGEQMEALIETGYSMFVERLIENNDLLDQQFLHFPFVVLLNRRVTASSGRPALSNISDKEGKVYIRIFTHMMWAVQHIQYCEMKANADGQKRGTNENDDQMSKEEQERAFNEQKEELQKVLAHNKEKQEKRKKKRSEGEAPKMEEKKRDKEEQDGKMYSCAKLTGYQLLKMVQRTPEQLTGGLMINNGVSKKLCSLAHNVTVKTEEIVEWDVDTAFSSDPVYRPYQ